MAAPGSRLLQADDDGLRIPGPESNWNESRYLDFFDPVSGLAGWCRLGNRPNEGHAEMSACLHLPAHDGRALTALCFRKPAIDANRDEAAGLAWLVRRPFQQAEARFAGVMNLLDDPWSLTDAKRALGSSPVVPVSFELTAQGDGLGSAPPAEPASPGRRRRPLEGEAARPLRGCFRPASSAAGTACR
jgi:hypothetical protein